MFNLIPYRNSENSLFHFFDNFERNFWGSSAEQLHHFRVDIADKGEQYELSAELPGMNKEDIHIDIEDNVLVISAQQEETKEEKDGGYLRRERRFGSFSRRFDVSDVETEQIQASYTDGILTLQLPKKSEKQLPPARQIHIQ